MLPADGSSGNSGGFWNFIKQVNDLSGGAIAGDHGLLRGAIGGAIEGKEDYHARLYQLASHPDPLGTKAAESQKVIDRMCLIMMDIEKKFGDDTQAIHAAFDRLRCDTHDENGKLKEADFQRQIWITVDGVGNNYGILGFKEAEIHLKTINDTLDQFDAHKLNSDVAKAQINTAIDQLKKSLSEKDSGVQETCSQILKAIEQKIDQGTQLQSAPSLPFKHLFDHELG